MDVVGRPGGSEYIQGWISVAVGECVFFWSIVEADSLSQSEQDQAGALWAADHLGNTDFLFLEQVSGTLTNVGDTEPDTVLAEVGDAKG